SPLTTAFPSIRPPHIAHTAGPRRDRPGTAALRRAFSGGRTSTVPSARVTVTAEAGATSYDRRSPGTARCCWPFLPPRPRGIRLLMSCATGS
ncbi:hypothetical protein, partial [Streptomyces clavuligerus]|uniref:hypothetical protein n=1 Tax=Streptomyces clavuligerus TaxID=1901 RepID=UPI001E5F149E